MIHKYKLNNYNIVLDINSGTVHVVDGIAYDILDNLTGCVPETIDENIFKKLSCRYSYDQIKDTYFELFKLYKTGQLFADDIYQDIIPSAKNTPIKSMCLNVAHDCNLRCEYCFAAKGDFGTGRELMNFDVAKSAVDFLVERSGTRHNLELDFFGGEPLMNFDVVKQTVEYARTMEKKYNKNFRFTITTNGLLLTDDKIDFINKEMSNVVLSLDGRPEVNDKLRVTETGHGSYDIIVPRYQKLVNSRGDKDYYVRGTFTKHNLDFTKDVMHINSLGFDQISVEPVVSDSRLCYSIKESDIESVCNEYETLSREIINQTDNENYFNFFHFMVDLDEGPCAIKRLKGCGCGNEYVAVVPCGDIYPCHQFVGMDHWKMGNVLTKTFNEDKKDYFSRANIYNKPDCKDCWAKFYCSGGCNANNFQYCGDVLSVHKIGCALLKKRVECAIMIKAHYALTGTNNS